MRDNHDKLPEILEALKENENFFCVVAMEHAEQTRKFRIGISHESYLALKRLFETRPFDQMPGISYRYFFVPNVQRLNDGRVMTKVRVEQGKNGKQIEIKTPMELFANLKWFFELDDLSKADHLRVHD
jgi:hypothetical protein